MASNILVLIRSINFRYYVRIYAVNAKGKSIAVNMKASTVKETSRLPLLPPEQSKNAETVSHLISVFRFL